MFCIRQAATLGQELQVSQESVCVSTDLHESVCKTTFGRSDIAAQNLECWEWQLSCREDRSAPTSRQVLFCKAITPPSPLIPYTWSGEWNSLAKKSPNDFYVG